LDTDKVMEKRVREIYEGDCVMKDAKYLLLIYDDGSLKLTWYCGERIVEEKNPTLRAAGSGLRLEYGEGDVKSSMPFTKYADGTLDDKWVKIK